VSEDVAFLIFRVSHLSSLSVAIGPLLPLLLLLLPPPPPLPLRNARRLHPSFYETDHQPLCRPFSRCVTERVRIRHRRPAMDAGQEATAIRRRQIMFRPAGQNGSDQWHRSRHETAAHGVELVVWIVSASGAGGLGRLGWIEFQSSEAAKWPPT
jgi:hypothetical protein